MKGSCLACRVRNLHLVHAKKIVMFLCLSGKFFPGKIRISSALFVDPTCILDLLD
ncbi:hypothetical protein IQ07DRAFT_27759 [Pyrenochaeta sp. DS3sAY3a]|nr:hypothetical protein IQ07DRAFT_27759 [Pyrenochaeta sp. DS3sAY3a]